MDFNICYFDSTIWQIVPCISSCDRRVLTNFDRFSASRHCVVFSYELKKGCFEDFSATKLQASKIGSQSDRKAWNNKSKFILYICNSCSSNFVSIYIFCRLRIDWYTTTATTIPTQMMRQSTPFAWRWLSTGIWSRWIWTSAKNRNRTGMHNACQHHRLTGEHPVYHHGYGQNDGSQQ